jgi:hypothetical protein
MRHLSSSVFVVCMVVLLLSLCAVPTAARGPTIKDIQPDDTVFVYEENLNLAGLRDPAADNPVTSLRQYVNDDPAKALIFEIPVGDDTDFDLPSGVVADVPAVYYAYNPTDGTTASIIVRKPALSLSVTLANPYHGDVVEGLSLPVNTNIAFRVTSPYVGSAYRVGATYPAAVDIVVTTPGGAETTVFGGQDLSNLPVASTEFHTDDPGYPGPVKLSGLEEGTYRVRVEWSAPPEFDNYAAPSNEISFNVMGKVGVDTTPTTAPPTRTPVPTETGPPAPTEPTLTPTPTTEETTPASPAPTGTTPEPTPTQAPPGIAVSIGAVLIVICTGARRR